MNIFFYSWIFFPSYNNNNNNNDNNNNNNHFYNNNNNNNNETLIKRPFPRVQRCYLKLEFKIEK